MVIDALVRLAGIDNGPIVGRVSRVLACQRELPPEAGESLAGAVRQWLYRKPPLPWADIRHNVTTAALRTRSEPARQVVLDALRNPENDDVYWFAAGCLQTSPGDADWCRRVRDIMIANQQARPNDAEFAKRTKRITDWLDARINHPER